VVVVVVVVVEGDMLILVVVVGTHEAHSQDVVDVVVVGTLVVLVVVGTLVVVVGTLGVVVGTLVVLVVDNWVGVVVDMRLVELPNLALELVELEQKMKCVGVVDSRAVGHVDAHSLDFVEEVGGGLDQTVLVVVATT